MATPLLNTDTLRDPTTDTASLSDRMKEWCTRVLAPDAYALPERREFCWTSDCLARAEELTHQLTQRYSLFVGLNREGLLIANLLANRFGTALSELQAFTQGVVWQSGQVKNTQRVGRVLVVVPADPQFTDRELRALENRRTDAVVEVTSVAPGAPILPVETVAALAHGPHKEVARARISASA